MNKVPRFISLMSDTTAKALVKDDHYRWFYEELIKYKTGIDLKKYNLMDNELNTGNKVKDYRADTIFLNKNRLVNLEFNQDVYDHTIIKNIKYALRMAGNGYLQGEQYYHRYVTQINLNNKIKSAKVKKWNKKDYKLEDYKSKAYLKDVRIFDTVINIDGKEEKVLNAKVVDIQKEKINDNDERNNLFIRKEKECDSIYPRLYQKIKKKPL